MQKSALLVGVLLIAPVTARGAGLFRPPSPTPTPKDPLVGPAPSVGAPAVPSSCFTDAFINGFYPQDAAGDHDVGPATHANNDDLYQLGPLAVTCSEAAFIDDRTEGMPDAASQQIASQCKAAYPGDTYLEIGCAEKAVDQYVDAARRNGQAENTDCRQHERAFRQVISEMSLPGVSAGSFCVSGTIYDPYDTQKAWPQHILNTVTVTGDDGKQYTYVVDTMYDPGSLFPMPGDDSCTYLGKNGPTLPPADHPPEKLFGVIPLPGWLTGQNAGVNVKRGDSTIPPRASASGSDSGGGQTR